MGYADRYSAGDLCKDTVSGNSMFAMNIRITASKILAADSAMSIEGAVDIAERLEEEIHMRADTAISLAEGAAQADWDAEVAARKEMSEEV